MANEKIEFDRNEQFLATLKLVHKISAPTLLPACLLFGDEHPSVLWRKMDERISDISKIENRGEFEKHTVVLENELKERANYLIEFFS